MLHGIFLDPRSWASDCLLYPNWNPEKYGVKIDLYDSESQINRKPPHPKYKFAIATEVWTVAMHKVLDFLSKKHGLKIFVLPRELALAEGYKKVMFKNKEFEYKGKCFFNPDLMLSPGDHYTNFWADITKTVNVGHPRFDMYATEKWHDPEAVIKKRYNIDPNKKIVFFASYWNKHYQDDGEKVYYADISKDLAKTTKVLEEIAKSRDDIQVIIKIHPMSQKLYLKGRYKMDSILEKYYHQKNGFIRVIKDVRFDGSIAKNLLAISDLVVSFRSTMLLEAMLLKKPVINIMFEQAKGLKGLPDFVERTYSVYDEQTLRDSILNFEDHKDRGPMDSSVVDDYFYKADGNFCERFCTEIKNNM